MLLVGLLLLLVVYAAKAQTVTIACINEEAAQTLAQTIQVDEMMAEILLLVFVLNGVCTVVETTEI